MSFNSSPTRRKQVEVFIEKHGQQRRPIRELMETNVIEFFENGALKTHCKKVAFGDQQELMAE